MPLLWAEVACGYPTFKQTIFQSKSAQGMTDNGGNQHDAGGFAAGKKTGNGNNQRDNNTQDYNAQPESHSNAAHDQFSDRKFGDRRSIVGADQVNDDDEGVDNQEIPAARFRPVAILASPPARPMPIIRPKPSATPARMKTMGRMPCVPERNALAVVHDKTAVDSGRQGENTGQDGENVVNRERLPCPIKSADRIWMTDDQLHKGKAAEENGK